MSNVEKHTLEMVPIINNDIGTIFNSDETVTITYPRYKKAWQVKWLLPKGRKNEIKLDFDKNGSAVWKLIDGQRTVKEILSELKGFEKEEQQFEARTMMFLQSLVQNDFIVCL